MANATRTKAAKAEIQTIDAAGRKLAFKLNINRLCDIEEVLGKPTGQIVRELKDSPSLRVIRAIFYAGLEDEDGDVIGFGDSGDVIAEVGFTRCAEMIGAEMTRVLGS